MDLLLKLGLDSQPLGWPVFHRAVASGNLSEVASLLEQGASLTERDSCERTPLHTAALTGNIPMIALLYSHGAEVDPLDRMGETPLLGCSDRGDAEMVQWLIEHGANIEAADGLGQSSLMLAASLGHATCVEVLLNAGAETFLLDGAGRPILASAFGEEVVQLLLRCGGDPNDISTSARRRMVGLPENGRIKADIDQYRSGKGRRFGRANPELMQIPFWNAMIRAGGNAYQPRKQFHDMDLRNGPVWCFDRFGMSFTELADGHIVQIGGEHEDWYDPDFCIYNEVVVHDRQGGFEIYGYPEALFPPTDFHTATEVGGYLYVIGRLGYAGKRDFGSTPVFRCDIRNWRVEAVNTTGDQPGWIFKHRARHDCAGGILVRGGEIAQLVNGVESFIPNETVYRLDLTSGRWEIWETPVAS